VPRHAVVLALPAGERAPVSAHLTEAGFEPLGVDTPAELEALLAARPDIAVAILDGETDLGALLECYELLRTDGRAIAALMMVTPHAFDRLSEGVTRASINDEYITRPYTAESLRWRVEAMLIRAQTVDDGSGPIIQTGPVDHNAWGRRTQVIAVFNPKGGVGKTTIAMNLAVALQVNHSQKVLLVDADTVTGHVTTSLGLEQVRTVVDSWRDRAEGGPAERLLDIAAEHPSGMRVVALTASPLHTEILEPEQVADEITAARHGFDFVVIDMHPSYSTLNQAIFDRADRILVPVTPDLPALRAAVQLREVAQELGIAQRLALVVNRANSGVSVADMEKTVGMPALALIRSGGLLFVRAANEGRTVVERFPREKVAEDFDILTNRLLGQVSGRAPTRSRLPVRSLFGQTKTPVRA
jgi:MinD-like ATPase involved in chromosome partitioning or flagellar assembly